jgi:peptidoglycan/LPS O-acetylase OafA/YrhL
LYYGTILIFFVAYLFHGFGGDSGVFLRRLPWLLTYTTNIRIALHNDWSFIFSGHSLGHFWSLAVEEQFYLIWPFIVLRCDNGVLKRICLIAIVGGLVCRMILLYGAHALLGSMVYLPCQSDALAMGALVAILVREREDFVAAMAWPVSLAGACLWVASLFDRNALITIGISGFGIMSAGALALCLYHPISKLFSISILRAFGKYSYGIYVWHVIALPFLWPLREKIGPGIFPIVFVPTALCTGWISWSLFEAHFLRLKKYFPLPTKRSWTPRLQSEPEKEPMRIVQAV